MDLSKVEGKPWEGQGGHSDLIVLLSAQTKGQLELDVIFGAAGRGLVERKYEGQGREARARVTGKEAGQQWDRGPGLSKIGQKRDTGSPKLVKMHRERKKLCT